MNDRPDEITPPYDNEVERLRAENKELKDALELRQTCYDQLALASNENTKLRELIQAILDDGLKSRFSMTKWRHAASTALKNEEKGKG